jgi:aerobic carbon-monoxide dehydrogenase small subunit
MSQLIHLTVNGRPREVAVAGNRTLLELLRYDLGLTGTKHGCGIGDCGACTVLLDHQPVNACLVLAGQCDGGEVLTIEGVAELAGSSPGESMVQLHPLQRAFIEVGAVQCGFCTPGMILVGLALLRETPQPTEAQIREAISGNLCRCTGYQKIVEAIEKAAEMVKRGGQG